MPDKALIIIDMLNDFIDRAGKLYCGETTEAIIPVIRNESAHARQKGELVVYLQDSHDTNDVEFERFPPHCIAGSWGSRIISDLAPVDGETVLPKKRYSGFFGTDLDTVLARSDVKDVMVVGVCTSICVMDTAGGLANRDYKVIVPVEGVADFDQKMHRMALERMEKVYGAKLI